jgi:hypothetical protein
MASVVLPARATTYGAHAHSAHGVEDSTELRHEREGGLQRERTSAGRSLDERELTGEDGGDHLALALVELPRIKILGEVLTRVSVHQLLMSCDAISRPCGTARVHDERTEEWMEEWSTLGGGWAAHALGSLTFPNMRSRSRVPPGMGLTRSW